MKTVIIGHTSGGNFELAAKQISEFIDSDEKIKIEIADYEAKMDSFETTPTLEITNDYENVNHIGIDDYKSGKELRRERRKQERKLKKY